MDFEGKKKLFDSMSWQEQQKFAEQNKNNPEFQQFANQYLGGNKQTPPPTQPSNPAPVENNQQNQISVNGQNWENGGWNQQTSPSPQPSYDPNEQFDSSAFNNPNAQVQVQAGNAKQTWMPDYQDDSDARMGEITNNLNAYWNTNREYFSDRQTFNKVFSYEKRSKAQQAHFDSFWKRKEIDKKVAGYTDWKSVSLALEEGTLTKSQLEALKVQNPKVYAEYLEDQLNKKNLDLVNTGSKSRIFNEDEQISNNTDALTDMMRKLGFDMSADGRAKELYEKFKELKNDPKIDDMKQDYLEARKIYLQRRREFNTLPERIRAQSSWASETLISARINKAQRLAYNELQTLADEAQIRKEEYVLEYGEMKDEFNAFKDQADEEYRAFTSKMTALWFAKGILSFETPEQQRQGQLRQLEAQNQLTLQFEKDKIALQSELSDINSKDPKIQFNAVMKALDPHYKEFGSIILRPQAQAAQDIINLAKKEGISVGEAMRKNFTEELFKKPEYSAMMGKKTGISVGQKVMNIWGKPYIQTTNPDGTVSLALYGGSNSQSSTTYQWPDYTPVSSEKVQSALKQLNAQWDGSKWGQCWYFVNNYLESLGIGRLFTDPISAKKAVVNSSTPSIGSVAVIDRTNSPNASQAQKKYGHVGVVVGINKDGSVLVKQSNKAGEEKVFTLTYRADQVYWYFDPTKWGNSNLTSSDIISYNDKTLNRKLSTQDKNRIGNEINRIMSDPNADIDSILEYSAGGKSLTDSSTQPLMKYQEALNGIGTLSGLLKEANTGPIVWILRSNNPYDQKAREIQTVINQLVPTLARWVYWEVWVLTDADIKHYSKTVPNLQSTEGTNNAILALTLNMLAQGYKNKLRTLASAGNDVSRFWGLYKNIMDEVQSLQLSSLSGETPTRAKKYRWENNVLKTSGGDIDEEGFIY